MGIINSLPTAYEGLAAWRARGRAPLDWWFYPGMISGFTAIAQATGTLIAYPFTSPTAGVVDLLSFDVTIVGGAGSVARVGIYKNTSRNTLYPAGLVVDGGQFDTSAVGGTGVKSAAVSVTLAQDVLYWFAYLCGTAAPTVQGINGTALQVIGFLPAMGTNAPQVGISVAQAYGALPDPFPANATTNNNTQPLAAIRYEGP